MSETIAQRKLKKFEKETHVHFSEDGLTATIQTYNSKWINRLLKYEIQPTIVDDTGLHIFEGIHAHWMIPRRPPKRTEAQIEASRRNMQRLLEDGGDEDMMDGDDLE